MEGRHSDQHVVYARDKYAGMARCDAPASASFQPDLCGFGFFVARGGEVQQPVSGQLAVMLVA